MEIIPVEIDTEFIELNHLLKLAGQALSGGEGKVIVASGAVFVDGEQELRMRCKIRPGMMVRYKEVGISVTLAATGIRAPKVVGVVKTKPKAKPVAAKPIAPTTQKRRPRGGAGATGTSAKVKAAPKTGVKFGTKLPAKPSGNLAPGPGNKGVSRGGAKVDAKRNAKFGIKN
jgi:ribosome-associated protein